jgi:hypothetical protein
LLVIYDALYIRKQIRGILCFIDDDRPGIIIEEVAGLLCPAGGAELIGFFNLTAMFAKIYAMNAVPFFFQQIIFYYSFYVTHNQVCHLVLKYKKNDVVHI